MAFDHTHHPWEDNSYGMGASGVQPSNGPAIEPQLLSQDAPLQQNSTDVGTGWFESLTPSVAAAVVEVFNFGDVDLNVFPPTQTSSNYPNNSWDNTAIVPTSQPMMPILPPLDTNVAWAPPSVASTAGIYNFENLDVNTPLAPSQIGWNDQDPNSLPVSSVPTSTVGVADFWNNLDVNNTSLAPSQLDWTNSSPAPSVVWTAGTSNFGIPDVNNTLLAQQQQTNFYQQANAAQLRAAVWAASVSAVETLVDPNNNYSDPLPSTQLPIRPPNPLSNQQLLLPTPPEQIKETKKIQVPPVAEQSGGWQCPLCLRDPSRWTPCTFRVAHARRLKSHIIQKHKGDPKNKLTDAELAALYAMPQWGVDTTREVPMTCPIGDRPQKNYMFDQKDPEGFWNHLLTMHAGDSDAWVCLQELLNVVKVVVPGESEKHPIIIPDEDGDGDVEMSGTQAKRQKIDMREWLVTGNKLVHHHQQQQQQQQVSSKPKATNSSTRNTTTTRGPATRRGKKPEWLKQAERDRAIAAQRALDAGQPLPSAKILVPPTKEEIARKQKIARTTHTKTTWRDHDAVNVAFKDGVIVDSDLTVDGRQLPEDRRPSQTALTAQPAQRIPIETMSREERMALRRVDFFNALRDLAAHQAAERAAQEAAREATREANKQAIKEAIMEAAERAPWGAKEAARDAADKATRKAIKKEAAEKAAKEAGTKQAVPTARSIAKECLSAADYRAWEAAHEAECEADRLAERREKAKGWKRAAERERAAKGEQVAKNEVKLCLEANVRVVQMEKDSLKDKPPTYSANNLHQHLEEHHASTLEARMPIEVLAARYILPLEPREKRNILAGKPFRCPTCFDAFFPTLMGLRRHMREEHNEKPKIEEFEREYKVATHLRMTVPCPVCNPSPDVEESDSSEDEDEILGIRRRPVNKKRTDAINVKNDKKSHGEENDGRDTRHDAAAEPGPLLSPTLDDTPSRRTFPDRGPEEPSSRKLRSRRSLKPLPQPIMLKPLPLPSGKSQFTNHDKPDTRHDAAAESGALLSPGADRTRTPASEQFPNQTPEQSEVGDSGGHSDQEKAEPSRREGKITGLKPRPQIRKPVDWEAERAATDEMREEQAPRPSHMRVTRQTAADLCFPKFVREKKP